MWSKLEMCGYSAKNSLAQIFLFIEYYFLYVTNVMLLCIGDIP